MWNKPRVVPPPRKPVVVPPPLKFKSAEPVPVYFDSVTGLQISPPGSPEPSTSTRRPKPSCSPSMKLLQKWETEKTAKMQELAVSDTRCHEDSSSEFEDIQEEVGNDDENPDANGKDFSIQQTNETLQLQHHRGANQDANDKDFLIEQTNEILPLQRHRGANQDANDKDFIINQTNEILQCHLGAPGRRSDKKWSKKTNKSSWKRKHAKSNYADDGKKTLRKIDVQELRYSQLGISRRFQCGRSVFGLVQQLLDRKVSLSASFLRLTVFETLDEETNGIILRCIDNRRLFALKEYAKKIRKPVEVNVDFFSYDTVRQFERFQQNSDQTNGTNLRVRKKRNRNQTW